MRRLGAVVPFIIVTVAVFLGFAAVGGPLGEAAYGMAESLASGSSVDRGDALMALIGMDALAIIAAFVISVLAGTSVPSGLPHVAFGLSVPLRRPQRRRGSSNSLVIPEVSRTPLAATTSPRCSCSRSPRLKSE